MTQEGSLLMCFKTSEDAQRALATVKDVLKKSNCSNWYDYVASKGNQIFIGDGMECYYIDVTEYEGVLSLIGRTLAIDNPEQTFSGYASFSNSTTGFECYDKLTYDCNNHILTVRESYTVEETSYYEAECDHCGEYIGISLDEYQGQTELPCPKCSEIVPLEGIEDVFDTQERRFLIKNGTAEEL